MSLSNDIFTTFDKAMRNDTRCSAWWDDNPYRAVRMQHLINAIAERIIEEMNKMYLELCEKDELILERVKKIEKKEAVSTEVKKPINWKMPLVAFNTGNKEYYSARYSSGETSFKADSTPIRKYCVKIFIDREYLTVCNEIEFNEDGTPVNKDVIYIIKNLW